LRDKQAVFYESIYNQELELKEKLLVGIQITAALIITNGSSLIYMLRNLDYNASLSFKILFYVFASINILTIIISSVLISISYKSSEYKTIPRLNEIHDYIKDLNHHNEQLDEYNKTNKTTLPLVDIKEKFNDYMLDLYVDCATYNADANQRRSAHSYNGKTWAFISYIPLFVCSLLFIIEDMDAVSARKPVDISYPKLFNILARIENKLSNPEKDQKEEITCQKTLPLLRPPKPQHHHSLDLQEMAIFPQKTNLAKEEKKNEQ
jgi:hypothetical protein